MPLSPDSAGPILPPYWEERLRTAMARLGYWVEQGIDSMIRLRGRVGAEVAQRIVTAQVQPILAIEDQLAAAKLRELIQFSEKKLIFDLMPPVLDRSVLIIGEHATEWGEWFRQKGGGMILQATLGPLTPAVEADTPSGIYTVSVRLGQLPFAAAQWDVVIATMATHALPGQLSLFSRIQDVVRVTANGGRAIVLDYHPFGRFAKRGRGRLRNDASIRGISDYYEHAKTWGARVTAIREIFLDDEWREFFATDADRIAFRALKGTPLLLGLELQKE